MAMIKLYNSLTREKQAFHPIDPGHVRVYACGPTVYNYAHIGNARMAVVFDLLVTVLRHTFSHVTYVSNITDIEDKIIEAARVQNVPFRQITEKYARIYNDDMAALGVRAPDIQPLATDHMPEMLALIESLIERGHAYEAEGHVLFHVPSDPSYGVLSGRTRDEQVAGARVEIAPFKRDPADFVLWKPSTSDQPGWDSPYGYGRPGWHIECSAMTEKHLGLPFDIHGGGADLKFPHHENEIAQSCCAHGHGASPEHFARYWVHNGFVTVEGEKMSKSLGNFQLVNDLLGQHKGETLRLALLSAHYRQPLDWSAAMLAQVEKQLDGFYRFLEEHADVDAENDTVPASFLEALEDDLNTPLALSRMHALLKEDVPVAEKKAGLLAAGRLLGILGQAPGDWFQASLSGDIDRDLVERLINQRQEAKKAKDFALADNLRNQLTVMGVVVEDTPQGPKWRLG